MEKGVSLVSNKLDIIREWFLELLKQALNVIVQNINSSCIVIYLSEPVNSSFSLSVADSSA